MGNSHVSFALVFLSSISSWRLPSPSPASLHWLLQQRRQPRTITKTTRTPASSCQAFYEINAHFRNSNSWYPPFLALLSPISWSSALETLVLENHVSSFGDNCNRLIKWWLFLNKEFGISSQSVDMRVVYDQGHMNKPLDSYFFSTHHLPSPSDQSVLGYVNFGLYNIINL